MSFKIRIGFLLFAAHRPLNQQLYKRKLTIATPRSDTVALQNVDSTSMDEDSDQVAKSSIQDTKVVNNRLNNIVTDTSSQEENVVNAVKALSKAPLPLQATPKAENFDKEPISEEQTTQRIVLPLLTTSMFNL